MLEKEVHDFEVASLRGPEYWGGLRVAAFRIHRSACLEEEVAESVVSIDRCPLDPKVSDWSFMLCFVERT